MMAAPVGAPRSEQFRSFFLGGFECSTHRRGDGRRLDVIAATRHDVQALSDYRQLAAEGLATMRDGVRWHLIEAIPGVYDWSSLDPMLAAGRAAGVEVIWDLLHYGWPDWTDPWRADFGDHFVAFAEAVARRIGDGGCYVVVNEISFLAWGGGEVGYLNPFTHHRGNALKHILCAMAIAASKAIRAIDRKATLVSAEPLIKVHPADLSPAAITRAVELDAAQHDAVEIMLGRHHPELGGREELIDVIGVNYYPDNQWVAADPMYTIPAGEGVPLAELLLGSWQRYRRPVLIAETGCEGDGRAAWFHSIVREAETAIAAGAEIAGVCLYPVLDHAGWDDDRDCPNGLFSGLLDAPRPAHPPLLAALREEVKVRGGLQRRSPPRAAAA